MLTNHLGSTVGEWGMMCLSGQKIHKNMIETYTSPSKKDDIVGLVVDLNSGRLEFTRNGLSLGIAFDNVKGPISPCVSLLKGQKVTLINDSNKKEIQKNQNKNALIALETTMSRTTQIIQNQEFEGGVQDS